MLNIADDGSGLGPMVFKVGKILEKLIENRAAHVKAHGDAMKNYRIAVNGRIKEVHAALGDLMNSEQAENPSETLRTADQIADKLDRIPQPSNYVEHYDRAIAMFTDTTSEEVTIGQKVYQQLVMDKWDWMDGLISRNATVNAIARGYTGG